MDRSWKIVMLADRETVEAALVAHEDVPDWDAEIVLWAGEVAPDRPHDWKLEAFLPREPTIADKTAVATLFAGTAPAMTVEELPAIDWVSESQRALAPILAGRFHVRAPDHPALDEPGVIDMAIPASQAFGTGHHETTSGCLAMLGEMKKRGVIVRNCADIGTGTGLLAFAALALWPRALALASDIDPVCVGVVMENAARNGVVTGGRAGELVMTVAEGMDHPLIETRKPYDLIMANILAGPLIELAPAFGTALVPGGNLLLAGLLSSQEAAVRKACRRAGLRLAARLVKGDWSILWLRRRASR